MLYHFIITKQILRFYVDISTWFHASQCFETEIHPRPQLKLTSDPLLKLLKNGCHIVLDPFCHLLYLQVTYWVKNAISLQLHSLHFPIIIDLKSLHMDLGMTYFLICIVFLKHATSHVYCYLHDNCSDGLYLW